MLEVNPEWSSLFQVEMEMYPEATAAWQAEESDAWNHSERTTPCSSCRHTGAKTSLGEWKGGDQYTTV